LTDEAITRIATPLKTKARRTFKRGIDTMNDLFDHSDIIAPLRSGFPEAPLAQPDRVKSVPSTRRRGGLNASSKFWDPFDAFVARKRGKDHLGRPVPAEESEFKPPTAQTYENALNNATGVLERAGILLPGDELTLRDLCSVESITQMSDLWQLRMLDGEVDKEAATLHLTVERLSHIAVYSKFLRKKDRKKLQKLRDKVRKKAKRRGRMSAPREAWIKAFSRSTPQQLAVHGMPEALMREAQKILDDWDRLKKAKKHKIRMRALHLGIAAVQSAILFRGSALRASNLRGLPFRGEDAQLFLGQGEEDVRLSIPAALVKNGVEIEADFDDDARSVIDWYLREIRPRLIEDHPYGHNLADGDWLFPSKCADRPMEETTFADHYRVGVEAVGLDMTLHQARHITVYFILDEDPSALALAAAVLGDDVSTVEAHYAWMDGVKAVIEGRKLLQESRKKGLSNLRSGNSAERGSCILAFPLDVGLRVGGPFFVDLDEDGADEAQQRVFARKDPDLDGAPFQFLLDGALDRVGGAHPFAVVLGQGEDSEGFGDVFLKPVGQPGRGVAIAGNQIGQAGFGLGEIIRIPDRFQLLADAFADIGVWCMMDRVAGQMELAALPCRAAEHGAAGGAQAAVVVGNDELDPAHAAGDEALKD
jgi:hypothetical protein